MQTTICFDFGNTRLKYAIFEDDNFKDVFVLDNTDAATIRQLIEKYKPAYSILSSVINHDTSVENILGSSTKFHKLCFESRLPFTTPVGKPDTIGADRLALSAAAVDLYPDQHNLVIGLGSCIT